MEKLDGFAVEVEGFTYFIMCGVLVKAYIADVSEQGEIDVCPGVFLVVSHQLEQPWIVVACDLELSVVVTYKVDRLSHLVSGESKFDATKIEFADDSPCHSITMWI